MGNNQTRFWVTPFATNEKTITKKRKEKVCENSEQR
jgi:hypothetical protein